MKNRNIVKQDYQLVNAKYKLTTAEIRFVMIALTQLENDDTEFKEYEIKVSELEEKLQTEQNETRLKQFAKKLLSKPLEVPTEDGFIVANWFADVEYIKGQSKFKVSFSKKLIPYLLELKKRYVSYNLKNILPLTSSYSIRIYQMLKEYEKLKIRYIKVDEMMDILQVPNSYKIYDNFKRKVLQVAEKELLEHCDIFFEYEEIKEGKRVNEILFRIKKNHWIGEKDNQGTFENIELDEELKQYIGKQIYLNGYDWKIISISKSNNLYSIFCHEAEDKSYTKTFELSEVQLKASK